MAVLHIKDYVEELTTNGMKSSEIAKFLSVSTPMVSSYRNHKWNASLEVAKKVYVETGRVLHPFSEESLKFEIGENNE